MTDKLTDKEIIGERRGMFGVHGSGDTSGYGRLVREVGRACRGRPGQGLIPAQVHHAPPGGGECDQE